MESGASLTMQAGDTTVVQGPSPRSDEAFQKLLLQFSAAAAQGTHGPPLIHLFCRVTREFFQVDGTYFWQFASAEELIGAEADGLMAERFRGRRPTAGPRPRARAPIPHPKTHYLKHSVSS